MPSQLILEDYGYQKQVFMKPNKLSKARKFEVVVELKLEEDRKNLSLLESSLNILCPQYC